MNKVIICTDNTSDLTEELYKKYDIKTIGLYVCFDQETYEDNVEINTEKLYQLVSEKNMLPKTAALTPIRFMEYFKPYLDQGYDVIYTGIGSDISSTFQNAYIAKNSLDNGDHLYLVDSHNLSSAIGLILLKMAKWRDMGMSAAEIAKRAEEIVPCVRAQFSVKKLDFLHKGGRCSGTVKFFGTMARVRPVIRVINGKLQLNDKAFGRYEKALDIMIKDLTDHIDEVDPEFVMITHSFGDEECAYIKEHIPAEVKSKISHLIETKAGCVISSHCGKETIGILYIRNHPVTE